MNNQAASHIHAARVYIAQAREFFKRENSTRSFGFRLLEWAGNERRKAMQLSRRSGFQADLFEVAA